MLVLSRHVGTSVYIGDDITVTVLGSNKNQVRLGIEAPRSVLVYREEIYLRIQLEKIQLETKTAGDESLPEVASTEGAEL